MGTKQLSPTMQAAYDKLTADGVIYNGNGVSLATVKALQARGLATVTGEVHTETNYRSKRTRSTLDWVARPVKCCDINTCPDTASYRVRVSSGEVEPVTGGIIWNELDMCSSHATGKLPVFGKIMNIKPLNTYDTSATRDDCRISSGDTIGNAADDQAKREHARPNGGPAIGDRFNLTADFGKGLTVVPATVVDVRAIPAEHLATNPYVLTVRLATGCVGEIEWHPVHGVNGGNWRRMGACKDTGDA